jgi:hypothetical protein
MPTYAVVHSTVSGMLRRVVADDDGVVTLGRMPDGTPAIICAHGDNPPGYHPLSRGESAVIMQAATAGPADWKNAIRSKTGEDPADITCALIESNLVVSSVIMADPAVDQSPDSRLMIECYSPQITIGCSYDPGTGLFSSAKGVLPPGSPGNPTDDPIIIPPQVIPRP